MNRMILCFFFLSGSFTTFAQEKPAVEIFGGYSFTRISPETATRRESLNGGHASVTINGGFMDFVIDASGYKGGSAFTDVTTANLMVGVRFGRQGKRISWYIQQLYGVSQINTEGRLSPLSVTSDFRESKNSFASVPAGLVIDAKLSERIAIRIVQADFMFIQRAYPLSSINPRISTGIVIRLGKK